MRAAYLLSHRSEIDGYIVQILQIDQRSVLAQELTDLLRRSGGDAVLGQQRSKAGHLRKQETDRGSLGFMLGIAAEAEMPETDVRGREILVPAGILLRKPGPLMLKRRAEVTRIEPRALGEVDPFERSLARSVRAKERVGCAAKKRPSALKADTGAEGPH